MLVLQHSIESVQSARSFVELCEDSFEKKLDETVSAVLDGHNTKIITLAGPTCSGKTTTAKKLTREIEQTGRSAKVISIDDFYKDNIRNGELPDLESAAALDLDYFEFAVSELLCGNTARLPVYDLGKGIRLGFTEYVPSENDIYIFEGIQAVYPEVTRHLQHFPYKSLFVSVSEDVSLNGTVFDKNEIRLIRRLVRDSRFRNTDFPRTMELWRSVRENEEKNIFPNSRSAEHSINSFLPYELLLMGKYLLPEANAMGSDIEQYPELCSVRDKLQKTTNEYISEEMIARESMFREFIG